MTKIAISLPADRLGEIEALAQDRRIARSALIREGMDILLQIERRRKTVRRARELYAEIAADEAALAETFQPLIAESLPVYDRGKEAA